MKRADCNSRLFIALIVIYIIGQFLIGTYSPSDKKFHFDTPADVDFLYYGAIGNQLLNHFPAQNPALCGVNLTQPYLQYYPLAILAKLVNPYNGIRILNVLYLMIGGLLLKYYFPKNYLIPAAILFAGSTFLAQYNALGVDLVARGFTHAPSIILLIILFCDKRIGWRLAAVFISSIINGYLMLVILPALIAIFILERNREFLYLFIAGLIGLAAASIGLSYLAPAKSVFSIFESSVFFDPWDNLKHLFPFLIISFIYRERRMMVVLATAFVFGSIVHYNIYFPIFAIYFAGAMMTSSEHTKIERGNLLARIVAIMLFVGFLISACQKYDPATAAYFPRFDNRIVSAEKWTLENTAKGDRFLAFNADQQDLALVMEYRPVYLGYIGHLAHLNLEWRDRYNLTLQFYKNGFSPAEVDYIFYGPVERKYFPEARLSGAIVYKDEFVTIIKVKP